MRKLIGLVAMGLMALGGCEATGPEDGGFTETWNGIATPAGTEVGGETSDGIVTAADTVKIWINFERPALEDRVIATFAIWEAESDPCNLWWLADKGGTDPCFYMTKGGGIQVPLMSPTSRVIDFTLPGLGGCELAGPVDGDRWIAHLRCGPTGYLYYWVNLTRGFTEYPRG